MRILLGLLLLLFSASCLALIGGCKGLSGKGGHGSTAQANGTRLFTGATPASSSSSGGDNPDSKLTSIRGGAGKAPATRRSGLVAGTVLDASGRPRPGAQVEVVDLEIIRTGGAPVLYPAAQGHFEIGGLDAGRNYRLIARVKDGNRMLVGQKLVVPPDSRATILLTGNVAYDPRFDAAADLGAKGGRSESKAAAAIDRPIPESGTTESLDSNPPGVGGGGGGIPPDASLIAAEKEKAKGFSPAAPTVTIPGAVTPHTTPGPVAPGRDAKENREKPTSLDLRMPPSPSSSSSPISSPVSASGAVSVAPSPAGDDEWPASLGDPVAYPSAAPTGATSALEDSEGGIATPPTDPAAARLDEVVPPSPPPPLPAEPPTPQTPSPSASAATTTSARVPSCVKVGDRLENFALYDVKGEVYEFARHRKPQTRLFLLDFWFSDCVPCRRAVPKLNAWQQKYGPHGLEVIGITYEQGTLAEKQQKLNDNLRSYRLDVQYRLLFGGTDEGGQQPCPLHKALMVHGYPSLVLVNAEGKILGHYQGLDADRAWRLETLIHRTLDPRQTSRRQ